MLPAPSANDIRRLLESSKTIAVVGMSNKPYRDSYSVAMYLERHGYQILPVNPNLAEIEGMKSYPSLLDIRNRVDIVDIFRRGEFVPEIVDQAIEIGAKAVWLQLGVHNDEAVRKAREAGLTVIQDACLKVVHASMFGGW